MKKLTLFSFVVGLISTFSECYANTYHCDFSVNNKVVASDDFEKRKTKDYSQQWAIRTEGAAFYNPKTGKASSDFNKDLFEENDPIIYFVVESEYPWVHPTDGNASYQKNELVLSASIGFEDNVAQTYDYRIPNKYRKHDEIKGDAINFNPSEPAFSKKLNKKLYLGIKCGLN